MMDNSVCMALVPYKGSYRHASLLERIFAKRRWLYFFLLPLTVASAFSGTYYYAVYAANGVSVPFADSMISVFGFSSDSFFVLLFLLTAAYTVFSPSGALVLLVPVSFSLGYYTATLYDIAGFCMYFVFFLWYRRLLHFSSLFTPPSFAAVLILHGAVSGLFSVGGTISRCFVNHSFLPHCLSRMSGI